MKQHLGRQSGVQKVEVSLLDGKVDVTPKEDGQIDPVQLLKATYDSGVTAAEMDMSARGNGRTCLTWFLKSIISIPRNRKNNL